MGHVCGAEFRRVENRDHLGKPSLVAVAVRSYDTTVDDLWDAITTPERLARWFMPVEGDLPWPRRSLGDDCLAEKCLRGLYSAILSQH